MIFGSVTGTIPPGPTSTGCTDPIVVPGAIAARSVDTSRIVPALHACAPTGPTHPRIGTSRALLNISARATVSASPPPAAGLVDCLLEIVHRGTVDRTIDDGQEDPRPLGSGRW